MIIRLLDDGTVPEDKVVMSVPDPSHLVKNYLPAMRQKLGLAKSMDNYTIWHVDGRKADTSREPIDKSKSWAANNVPDKGFIYIKEKGDDEPDSAVSSPRQEEAPAATSTPAVDTTSSTMPTPPPPPPPPSKYVVSAATIASPNATASPAPPTVPPAPPTAAVPPTSPPPATPVHDTFSRLAADQSVVGSTTSTPPPRPVVMAPGVAGVRPQFGKTPQQSNNTSIPAAVPHGTSAEDLLSRFGSSTAFSASATAPLHHSVDNHVLQRPISSGVSSTAAFHLIESNQEQQLGASLLQPQELSELRSRHQEELRQRDARISQLEDELVSLRQASEEARLKERRLMARIEELERTVQSSAVAPSQQILSALDERTKEAVTEHSSLLDAALERRRRQVAETLSLYEYAHGSVESLRARALSERDRLETKSMLAAHCATVEAKINAALAAGSHMSRLTLSPGAQLSEFAANRSLRSHRADDTLSNNKAVYNSGFGSVTSHAHRTEMNR